MQISHDGVVLSLHKLLWDVVLQLAKAEKRVEG